MNETMLHLHLMNTHGADFAQAGRLAINGGSCPACAGQHDIDELLATTAEVENDADYHPWRCGANCEVCADR